MWRSVVFLFFAGSIGVIAPESARACSCAVGDPREMLQEADAAFIGMVIELPDYSDHGFARWKFQVERSIKGDLDGTVTIVSVASGSACGLELDASERVGLFLRESGGNWKSGLCSQVAPETLLEAEATVDQLPPGDDATSSKNTNDCQHARDRILGISTLVLVAAVGSLLAFRRFTSSASLFRR